MMTPEPDFRPSVADHNFMGDFGWLDQPPALVGHLPDVDADPMIPFPSTCLTPFQRDLLEEFVNCFGARPGLVGPAILAAWSAVLCGSWTAFDGTTNHTDSPNLHVTVAGETGAGKSAISSSIDPCLHFEKVYRRLARPLKGKKEPSFIADSVTGAALVELLKPSDHKIFVYSTDAGAIINDLISQAKSSSNGFFDLYLRGYSLDPFQQGRITRSNYQGRPCLSSLLLAQNDLVHNLVKIPEFISRGMASRWLMVEIPKRLPTFIKDKPPLPNPSIQLRWKTMLREALRPRLLKRKSVMKHAWSDEALRIFDDQRNRLVPRLRGEWEHCHKAFERTRENHKRIALGLLAAEVISGNKKAFDQDEDIALRAGFIADWFVERKAEFFVKSEAERMADLKTSVVEQLFDQPDYEKSVRDFKNSNGIEESDLKKLIKCFPDKFEFVKNAARSRKNENGKNSGGRPSKCFRLKVVA
jgi:hypothetical protein